PCSCGVRAVFSVVIAAAVVDGKIVVASMSCARSCRSARSRIDATNGMSPAARSARSCARPSPSASTTTTCRTPSRSEGSSERSEATPSPGPFVMPGMINCHCHLTLDGEASFGAEVRQSDALATLKAFRNARAALRAGVTTVRDLSANGTMVIELGRAVEKGFVEGPRVVACGRGVTTTGGHGFEVGRIADGADEVRKAVREQVAAGARVIKLFSTGGILGDGAP